MFEDYINSNGDKIVNDLIELINIKTVNDIKKPNMPYGEGVYKGLKYILDKGNGWKFKTQNYLGHCGHIEAGNGEYTIGILCNVDVPEPVKQWTKNPFLGEVNDGKIYGLGARTTKGSLIACLYAMKILNDEGLIPEDKKIRLLLGCDKYKDGKSINYYKEYEDAPEIGFSPDGVFPVIYGEKGIIDLTLKMRVPCDYEAPINIVEISGGKKGQGVPDKVNMILSCEEIFKIKIEEELKAFAQEEGLEYKIITQNKLVWIELQGKSARSCNPEEGVNAISYGMKFLGRFEEVMDRKALIDEYEKLISTTYHGERINCNFKGDESGEFTFNVEEIKVDSEGATIMVNITHPISYLYTEVLEQVKDGFKYTNLKIDSIDHARPITFSKDSFVVKKLLKAYRDVTGDKESEPYTMAEKSFARAISNTIAFGPVFPTEAKEELSSKEYISIENLFKLVEIYARGLIELMK